MNWYLEVLKKYAAFSGRARRKEYWMFTLVSTIIWGVLAYAELSLGIRSSLQSVGMLSMIYMLVVLLPSIAVTVRRLHDTGRSGWWLLLLFLPLVGPLALLVFSVQDSEAGSNDYGPNPKMA